VTNYAEADGFSLVSLAHGLLIPLFSPEGPFASTRTTPRAANVRIIPNAWLHTLGARTFESLVLSSRAGKSHDAPFLRAMNAGLQEIGNKALTMAAETRRSENENAQHPPYEE
jgi:hypothetical protein